MMNNINKEVFEKGIEGMVDSKEPSITSVNPH